MKAGTGNGKGNFYWRKKIQNERQNPNSRFRGKFRSKGKARLKSRFTKSLKGQNWKGKIKAEVRSMKNLRSRSGQQVARNKSFKLKRTSPRNPMAISKLRTGQIYNKRIVLSPKMIIAPQRLAKKAASHVNNKAQSKVDKNLLRLKGLQRSRNNASKSTPTPKIQQKNRTPAKSIRRGR